MSGFIEWIMNMLMRMVGIRMAEQLLDQGLGSIDRAQIRGGSPERDALIRVHHQVVGSLMGGALPEGAATAPQLIPPAAPAPGAAQGASLPLPNPAPAAQVPVPPAVPAKRRGRPPKQRPVDSPAPSSNGAHIVSDPTL
jgi:hypothetical protein